MDLITDKLCAFIFYSESRYIWQMWFRIHYFHFKVLTMHVYLLIANMRVVVIW